jgi:hypothetical protein
MSDEDPKEPEKPEDGSEYDEILVRVEVGRDGTVTFQLPGGENVKVRVHLSRPDQGETSVTRAMDIRSAGDGGAADLTPPAPAQPDTGSSGWPPGVVTLSGWPPGVTITLSGWPPGK